MKVSDLRPHELFTAQADEGLDVAADRMNWHQVGALPVLDGQRLAGIMVVGGRDPVASPPSV
jgi:CBS domain-containing protein